MITLEQIRLLESKITRALELIRVLKDENSTLRKGLESAQRRMRELETLVEGFKTDQKEIESVIVRTLHNLDELEESAVAEGSTRAATKATAGGVPGGGLATPGATPAPGGAPSSTRRSEPRAEEPSSLGSAASGPDKDPVSPSSKEELDIF
jgi:hypothetical protein